MTKTINTRMFTEEQRNAFYKAFVSAGGPDDADGSNPAPWGCPWEWEPTIEVDGNTVEEWAASWYAQNKDEIDGLI